LDIHLWRTLNVVRDRLYSTGKKGKGKGRYDLRGKEGRTGKEKKNAAPGVRIYFGGIKERRHKSRENSGKMEETMK